MALDLSALDNAFEDTVGTGAPARAALSLFEEDPDQPRFEENVEALEALVADIRAKGVLQPVVVRRRTDGKLIVRFGARRLRAARVVGLSDLPYVVTEDPRQLDDYAQVSENERRHPLQPLELARFIEKKKKEGESFASIAARLNMHPSSITHLMALDADAPAFLLELYHSCRCRSPYSLYALRLLSEKDLRAVEAACAACDAIDRQFITALEHSLAAPELGLGGASVESALSAPPAERTSPSKAPRGRTKRPPAPLASSLVANPLHFSLRGEVDAQQVELDFSSRASDASRAVVRFANGHSREVALSDITFTRLEFS